MADSIAARMEATSLHAADFAAWVDALPVEIPPSGVLAGPGAGRFEQRDPVLGRQGAWGEDNHHFAMNLATLMRLGFAGIAREARAGAGRLTGEDAATLEAIARCHEAACAFAARHAAEAKGMATRATPEERERLQSIERNCRALAERAPGSFAEAVQLFWLAWNLRGQGTIGRLDQHLYPSYRADLAAGRLTRDEAFALLCELWERINDAGTIDTLVNLVVGGQDREGNDATNDLSYLMLDVARAVRRSEPYLAVRLHAGTPAAFVERMAELQLLGHGQGTLYNDDVLIASLVEKGVPLESARCYCNDGCSELTIDGESPIAFVQMEAVKSLELTLFNGDEAPRPGPAVARYRAWYEPERPVGTSLELGFRTGDFAGMGSFREVYDAFLRQYLHQLDRHMERLCDLIRHQREHAVTSPFLAGTFPQTLATGVDPLRGGYPVPCYMLFAGSIPTAADGLAAIRQVVFEERFCSPGELLDALRADFQGYEPLRRRCLAAPKFGNDDDAVDLLAADIARRFCERVVAHPTPTGKPFWPALYNYLFNDHAKRLGATPDGRRWGDPISEHYSPTPSRARKGPTAVIASAAKGPLAEACGSSIFNVSLSRSMAPHGEEGKRLLLQLLEGARKLGVAVMNTAIYDVAEMRDAQAHPEAHGDLIVRVWGYSARFVDLCREMQEHVIARTLAG